MTVRKGCRGSTPAQIEAREHNYSKMVIAAARASIGIQLRRDKRLQKSVYAQEVQLIVAMLNNVLNNWK